MTRYSRNLTTNYRREILDAGYTDAQIDRMIAIVRRYPDTYGPFRNGTELTTIRNICGAVGGPEAMRVSKCCLAEAI